MWPADRSAGRLLSGCEPRGSANLSARRSRLESFHRHGYPSLAEDGRQVMGLEVIGRCVRIGLGEGAALGLTTAGVTLAIAGGMVPLLGEGEARAGSPGQKGRLECLTCCDGMAACVVLNACGERFQIEIACVSGACDDIVNKVVVTRLNAERAPMEQLEVAGLDSGRLSIYRSFAGALTAGSACYGIEYTFERRLFGR